jgi:hypothetical protein
MKYFYEITMKEGISMFPKRGIVNDDLTFFYVVSLKLTEKVYYVYRIKEVTNGEVFF